MLITKQLGDALHHTRDLVMENWPQDGTFARHFRQARLLVKIALQAPCDIIPPTFDPAACAHDQ